MKVRGNVIVERRNPPLQKVIDSCKTLKIGDALGALTYAYYKVIYKGEEIWTQYEYLNNLI